MSHSNASGPLRNYRTLPEIHARLAVLYAKADRIVTYNATLDPSVLDDKQLVTMAEKKRVLGVDEYPSSAFTSLRATIDYLERRRRRLERQMSRVMCFPTEMRRPSLWQRLTQRAA